MKSFIICLLAAALLVNPPVSARSPAPAEGRPVTSSEYAALSAFINAYYGKDFGLILINDRTETWNIRIHPKKLTDKWKELKCETLDSLIARNWICTRLEGNFTLGTDYILLPRSKYIEALTDSLDPDWDNLDKIYPDSQGFLTLSRVGFDSKGAQALIYYNNAYRCSGKRISPAKRNIAFLKRKDGVWIVVGIEREFDSVFEPNQP